MSRDLPRPQHHPDVVCTEVLDELIAYVPASSSAVSLNVSARAIWELCDGTRTVEDIARTLSEETGCEPSLLAGDVESTLARFHELGLLKS